MTELLDLQGQCMCGVVKFSATTKRLSVVACHCDMCRRWSAGPFMSLNCGTVNFQDHENIGRVCSSEWAERGFCKSCGSNLFYKIVESNDYQMAVGLFDDQSKLRLSLQVFTERKPEFYQFANETKMMTGAEVGATFAPPSD